LGISVCGVCAGAVWLVKEFILIEMHGKTTIKIKYDVGNSIHVTEYIIQES
jgi:hypothetical protein